MPSVAYMNQSAPFWDFIASLEQQGQTHPMFSQNQNENAERGEGPAPTPFSPWGWGGWGGRWGGRGFPHHGPPGPPPNDEAAGEKDVDRDGDKEKDINDKDAEKEKGNGEGPSGHGEGLSGADKEGWGGHRRCEGGRHGRHGCHGKKGEGEGEGSGSETEGWGGRGRCGGGNRGRHGHHWRGGFGGRGRGWGGPWGWGRSGPFGGGAPFNPMAFATGLFNPESSPNKDTEDFSPEADIFDTPDAFVIHVSLPGAKKEDVGVNWDAEKSELSIAGVVYRPGDEEFLKTLAMDERKVGPFERKVRLGTRATPAQIDAEGISAKLEDGVLRVEVPKLETGFVDVKKVDIE